MQEHVLDVIDQPGLQTRSSLRRNGYVFCDDPSDSLCQLRAVLPRRMDHWSVHASGLLNVMHSAVSASSTDEEGQGVENTLWPKSGFWSSTGSEDARSAVEDCVYRLAGPACSVRYLRMLVYRAFYQHGAPVYPPMELQVFTGPTLDQLHPASPRHTVNITAAPQIFPLYAWAPVGRYLKVVFYGKHQCQFADDKYYIALNWLSALGTVVPAPMLQRVHWGLRSGALQVSPGGWLPAAALQTQQLTLREQQQGAVALPAGGPEQQQRRWRLVQRQRQQQQMQDKLAQLQQLHQRVLGEELGEEEVVDGPQQHHLVVLLRRQIRELQRLLAAEQQRLEEQLQEAVQQGVRSCAVGTDMAARLEASVEEFRRHHVALPPEGPNARGAHTTEARLSMRSILKWPWRPWASGSKQQQEQDPVQQQQQHQQQRQQVPVPSTHQQGVAGGGSGTTAPLVTPAEPLQGVYMLQGASGAAAPATAEPMAAMQQLPAAVASAAADAGAAVGLPALHALLQSALGVPADLPDRPVLVPWVFTGQLQASEVKLLAQEPALSDMGIGEPAGLRPAIGAVAALQQAMQQQAAQQGAEWQRWWQAEQGSLLLGWHRALQLLQQVADACEQPLGEEALTEAFGKLPSSWAFQMLARQLLAVQPACDSTASSSSSSSSGCGLARLHHAGADMEALPSALCGASQGPPPATAAAETAVMYQDEHTCITAGVQLQPGIESTALPLLTYNTSGSADQGMEACTIQLFDHTAPSVVGAQPACCVGSELGEVYEEGVVADLLVHQMYGGCPAA